MVYDDDTDEPVHLSLPLPDMRQLAAGMRFWPSEDVQAAIIEVAEDQYEESEDGVVDPYWVHADVQSRIGSRVTIDEVAAVMLLWLGIPL